MAFAPKLKKKYWINKQTRFKDRIKQLNIAYWNLSMFSSKTDNLKNSCKKIKENNIREDNLSKSKILRKNTDVLIILLINCSLVKKEEKKYF